MSEQYAYSSGYTCGSCGVWVPYGQEHYCGGTATTTFTYPCCVCFHQLQQLLDKLDKLLNLLEKREKKDA